MTEQKKTRTARRIERLRREKRRRMLIAGGAALAVVALGGGIFALTRPSAPDPVAEAIPSPTATVEAATAEPTQGPTAVPAEVVTEAPTDAPTPTPAPTAVPGTRPDVVSFYTPQGKNYSPRVKLGDSYTGPWKKGKDIGSFEVIASDADLLPGEFFGDIFGAAWTAFPDANSCKIGYTLRYTLDDGSEIRYSMLAPKHIEHTEFIEVWLYDDYHRKPHQFYSHLKDSQMKSDTLITSIKLTAGKQISRVTDIELTAFICSSLDEFDAERNYIGNTSCTIHIVKE